MFAHGFVLVASYRICRSACFGAFVLVVSLVSFDCFGGFVSFWWFCFVVSCFAARLDRSKATTKQVTFSLKRKPFGGSLYLVKMLCLRANGELTARFRLQRDAALRKLRAAILNCSDLPAMLFGETHYPAFRYSLTAVTGQ